MKVEIWSDIMCPFCYIGKRKFERALAEFPDRNAIQVEWRSFQLDPELKSMPGVSVEQYLAERKGQSMEWSRQAHAHVTAMAKSVGLTYNFDKAVIGNSWDAHRLIQFAKSIGSNAQFSNLGDAAEEAIFKAYFTEGKDVADHAVLLEIATSLGMDAAEVSEVLHSQAFADAVNGDLLLARQFGVQGVPFFVFDRKYAVSGAQEPATFLQVLSKSFSEWRSQQVQQLVTVEGGATCTPDGQCD